MTENPNTQPDPNAGQAPGGPVDQPATPGAAQPEAPDSAPGRPTAPRPAGGAAAGTGEGAAAGEGAAGDAAAGVGAAARRSSGTAQPTPAGNAGSPGSTEAARAASAAEAAQSRQAARPAAESAATPGEATAQPGAEAPSTGAFAETAWGSPDAEPGLAGPADPNAPKTSVAATFLPGIDAASVLALLVAALAAGAYLLVNPLVQAHDAARTWSDFKNNVPRAKQDPFGVQRDGVSYQSWGHIILGLVAVLLALLVLGLWTAQRNKLRSRSFAQAALVLGLAVVLYGILLKTGAVGSEIPSIKDISSGLSSSSSQ